MALNIIAVLWGIAESTLFFIVPDVFLSWIALENTKRACMSCLWALTGALLGGSLMYLWGINNPDQALSVLDYIPAISINMIQNVHSDLEKAGIRAVLTGPMYGIPYKIYAVQSANMRISYLLFILISVPARLVRFIIVTLIFGFISKNLPKSWTITAKKILHIIVWAVFYLIYFALKSD